MKAMTYPTVHIECDGCGVRAVYEFAAGGGLTVLEQDMIGGLTRQGWTITGDGADRIARCYECTKPDRLRMVAEYKARQANR